MSEQEFLAVDDKLVSKFEKAWHEGNPQPIEQCLPAEAASSFLGTLEELVHIDLEFRWKTYSANKDSDEARPHSVESYLERFPQLDTVKLGLVQGELELAHRFGSEVSVDEFVDRFGSIVNEQPLSEVLTQQLSELNRNLRIQPGVTLGRYEIVNEHGRGGFGAVWRATDTKLGRRIAVKQLGQRLANDAESRRRFISEARVTARLEHPGIVPVYDISNLKDDHAYYTMRLIRGRTMEQAIRKLHELDVSSNEFQLQRRQLLQSYVDVCRTIEYAHAQGVVHRDLKPQNIIVGDYGETILLDWGLASVVDETEEEPDSDERSLHSDPEVLTKEESIKSLQGRVMGTPAYMSPEQARGEIESVKQSSDIYSLGATLYHLATGAVPFTDAPLESLMERVKQGRIPPAAQLNSEVEQPLSHVVAKAMSQKSTNRYKTIGELVDDVQRFLADQPVAAYRDPLPARIARWIRKHPTTAAASALTLLFAVIAVAAGLSINHAWKTREQNRVAMLQVAAERADATALSQIKNGRFEAASKVLSQANELVKGEPALEQLGARIESRRQRAEQIVGFYSLGTKAQEETFFDRTNRSAIYCQAALDQLGVLQRADWWNHLPDQDLSPLQKDQLQSEIYRIMTLLASMRLAEISKDAVSLEILINPSSIDRDADIVKSIRAASFAAAAANRYRPSRAMQMIEQVGQVVDGTRPSIDLTNLNPLNSIDSAVMGSILDNNVPSEGLVRTAISGLLEMRNPNEVAKQWLDDALKYNPDWYWLPVFAGHSQVRINQPEAAIRTISHAVGVRPDYWVGYQYRALASISAAATQKSASRKAELLNAANRDIQRALDLEPFNSELYWSKAIIQYVGAANPDQIIETFLTALQMHQSLSQIDGGHYSGISRTFYARAKAFVDWQKGQGNASIRLQLLDAAIHYWQENFDEADQAIKEALTSNPNENELQQFAQLIGNERPDSENTLIEIQPNSRFQWHYRMSNAKVHGDQDRWTEQSSELQLALASTKVEWQVSLAKLKHAACLARLGKEDEAIRLLKETVALDRAISIAEVVTVAREANLEKLTRLCQELSKQKEPPVELIDSSTIAGPALLNADFELGLSSHWSPYTRRTTATSWNNFGKSRTTAEAIQKPGDPKQRCLHLRVDSPIEQESFGQMTQSVPVTDGLQYVLKFQAKVDSLEGGTVKIGIVDLTSNEFLHATTLDSETREWQQLEVPFLVNASTATIAIRAQGQSEVMLDQLKIESMDKAQGN